MCCYLLSCVDICCCLWLSVVIRLHLFLFVAIFCLLLTPVGRGGDEARRPGEGRTGPGGVFVIFCFLLLFVVIVYYSLIFIVICCYLLLFVAICCYMLLCVAICCYKLVVLFVATCCHLLVYVVICC